MNASRPCFSVVFVALLCASASSVFAQTIQFYGFSKRVNYLQTSSATPALSALPGDPDGTIYHFDADIQGTNLNLFGVTKFTLPNGTTQYNLVDSGGMDNTEFSLSNTTVVHGFSTKAALDTAFPDGAYSMTIATTTVPLSFGLTDNYPAEIPQVTGGTWDASGNLVINAATGATININTFSAYSSDGYIGQTVYSTWGNSSSTSVLDNTAINVTGFGSDPILTSLTIPPAALLPGRTYYTELTFGRLAAANTAAEPGALGHADYEYLTGFIIRTLGSFADMNGDGKTDLIWTNTTTGDRYVWLMNGTTFSSSVYIGTVDPIWRIVGTGDFNGDGKTDIVFENTTTGDRYVWLMNGTTYASSVYLGNVGTAWRIVGVGDFNGDGKPDLIFENTTTGDRYAWLMNGTTYASSVYLGNVGTAWHIVGAGDFNSDGKPDLIFENTSTGDRYAWLMNGTTYTSAVFLGNVGIAWHIAGVGDFNGDGKADLIFENTSTGDRYVWLMNGTTYSSGALVGNISTIWTIKE
jgi:hypothetical protein